jgi:hypothetical protein
MKNIYRTFIVSLLLISSSVLAERVVNIQWDQVDDSRVLQYELSFGLVSGDYNNTSNIDAQETTGAITFFTPGLYFVAVRACAEHICSDWSNELVIFWPNAPTNLTII